MPAQASYRCRKIRKDADPSMPVPELGLPSRITNILMSIGMRNVRDILEIYDKESMLAIPGLGKATYEKILINLEDKGFDVRHLRW